MDVYRQPRHKGLEILHYQTKLEPKPAIVA
ncbi:Uncharacterised protein [Vibrio cholerae]|nr:Uncharacterised protein [Vibrio cholerae]